MADGVGFGGTTLFVERGVAAKKLGIWKLFWDNIRAVKTSIVAQFYRDKSLSGTTRDA
jgi:hypothetical protein